MQVTAQGWRGVIYQCEKNGTIYAKKVPRFSYTAGAIEKEGIIMQHLSAFSLPFLPVFHSRDETGFMYEWVEGNSLDQGWHLCDEQQKYSCILQLLDIAQTLDQLGVVHGELHRPMKNVIIKEDGTIIVLDFDRGTLGEYANKNLKAVGQWLVSCGYITVEELRLCTRHHDTKDVYTALQGLAQKAFTLQTHHSPPAYAGPHQSGMVAWWIIVLVGLDQLTKYMVYDLQMWGSNKRITPVLNQGSARSMAIDMSVLIGVGVAIMVVIILLWRKRRMTHAIFIWMFAGAVGNMIDRIWIAGVRDFIDLHYWPIFNFADVYLTIALIIYLHGAWTLYKRGI